MTTKKQAEEREEEKMEQTTIKEERKDSVKDRQSRQQERDKKTLQRKNGRKCYEFSNQEFLLLFLRRLCPLVDSKWTTVFEYTFSESKIGLSQK